MATTSLNTKIGPTNADIANATALVVPDAADITAAVPSAASIATAVAAPSAATIASSVAGAVPTLAQINTAVNTQTNNSAIASAVAGAVPTRAQIQSDITSLGNTYNGPSAATIASTTAASVPTLAQINTAVSTNASPFGGTWTTVYDNRNVSGVSSVTVSGLGSYKYIKVIYSLWLVSGGGGTQLNLRLNGDTGSNYFYNFIKRENGGASLQSYTEYSASQIGFNFVSADFENQCTGTINLINAQAGSFKIVEGGPGRSRENNTTGMQLGSNSGWYSNAGITSLTIFNNNANFGTGGDIIILGAN